MLNLDDGYTGVFVILFLYFSLSQKIVLTYKNKNSVFVTRKSLQFQHNLFLFLLYTIRKDKNNSLFYEPLSQMHEGSSHVVLKNLGRLSRIGIVTLQLSGTQTSLLFFHLQYVISVLCSKVVAPVPATTSIFHPAEKRDLESLPLKDFTKVVHFIVLISV